MGKYHYEIDCGKCANLKSDKSGCKVFGDNEANAVKDCSANCFENYKDTTKQ